jgi:poly(3-hydroxybutyrate) depolymerase
MSRPFSVLARLSGSLALAVLLVRTSAGQIPIPPTPYCPQAPTIAGIHLLCIPAVAGNQPEYFALYLPTNDPNHQAPLVVGFHGFMSNLPADFGPKLTEVLQYLGASGGELDARDWYGLAPLGRHDATIAGMSFSSLNSQLNIANVMRWVLQRYGIDRNRIYGMGFSMGGGTVACIAARHLDPTDFMFAAIVDHTGAVALHDLHDCHGFGALSQFHGGLTPDQNPFSYGRSSAMDYESCPTPLVAAAYTQARNLTHVPTRIGYAAGDGTAGLVDQSNRLWQVLRWVYNHPDCGPNPNGGGSPWVSSGSSHAWDTMPASLVFSLFDAVPGLSFPTSARTLADRDGRWFHFDLEQTSANAFTPFDWTVTAGGNQELRLLKVANLDRIRTHDESLPFAYGTTLQVVVQADDGAMGDVVLEGYTVSPANVQVSPGTPVWSWDPLEETVTLFKTSYTSGSSLQVTWTITP